MLCLLYMRLDFYSNNSCVYQYNNDDNNDNLYRYNNEKHF